MTLNVLAFFAHPDDETMLTGGVLALLARQGAQVHLLCATRGEGGEVGDPPVCAPEALGQVREAELVCAARALGARSLTFLDYVDPRVGPNEELFPYDADLTRLTGQVAAALRQFDAHALLTHGTNGEYGHPAHVLTHQAARLAAESFEKEGGRTILLYTVAASFPAHPRPRLTNAGDPAHLVLDIRPALEQKTQAALCHRTQHALFVRWNSQEEGRQLSVPEVIITVEGLHRAYPPLNGRPPEDELAALLRPYALDGKGPGAEAGE